LGRRRRVLGRERERRRTEEEMRTEEEYSIIYNSICINKYMYSNIQYNT
jgi:hypothetical protein